MKVIVVANSKGGVGKSTTTTNLAVAAAHDGKKVMIIDADPQGSSVGFQTVRLEEAQKNDIRAVSITQPTIHKEVEGFQDYDLVIVDAGGGDNKRFRSAIMAAEKGLLIIPVQPSAADLWGTEITFQTLQDARIIFPELRAYALLNRVQQNTLVARDAKEALDETAKEVEVGLLKTVLHVRQDFVKAFGDGLGVIEYDPKGKAADEMRDLYKEVTSLLS